MRLGAPIFAAVALLAGSSSAESAAIPWSELYRSLKIPRIAEGAPCPVSPVDERFDFDRFGVADGIGPGPAYPIGLASGTLQLSPPRNFQSRFWGGQKVLWFVSPGYSGRLLIRGRQLDGQTLVRFDRGELPPRELRLERGVRRMHRERPSFTRLRSAGCYGYQIDGATFSRVIVFRAISWEN